MLFCCFLFATFLFLCHNPNKYFLFACTCVCVYVLGEDVYSQFSLHSNSAGGAGLHLAEQELNHLFLSPKSNLVPVFSLMLFTERSVCRGDVVCQDILKDCDKDNS